MRSARFVRFASIPATFLTGLLNQEAFRQRIEGEVARSRRYGRPVALAFVDLDDFKRINDTLGHAVGDRVLRELGGTIRRTH